MLNRQYRTFPLIELEFTKEEIYAIGSVFAVYGAGEILWKNKLRRKL